MTFSLKTYTKLVFPFPKKKEIVYSILGVVAKYDGLVENQILKHLTDGTKRKENWTIQSFLIPNGFLFAKTPKKSRRNVNNAFNKGIKIKPKQHYLTFKGLLASLAVTKFEENYLVRKHKELISRWLNKYNVPEFAIHVIKCNLELFVLKNLIEGSKLTGLNNIENYISSMNDTIFLDHKFPQVEDKKFYEMSKDVHAEFRISSQILNEALRKLLAELIETRKSSKGMLIHGGGYLPPVDRLPHYIGKMYDHFIRYWYSTIARNQFQDESKFNPFLIGEELKSQKITPLNIDNYIVNKTAKQILEKNGIQTDFDISQEPKFFTAS